MGSVGGQGAAPGWGREGAGSRGRPALSPRPPEAGAPEKGARGEPRTAANKARWRETRRGQPRPLSPPGLSQAAQPQSITWPGIIPACPAAWGICRIISPSSASLFPSPGPHCPPSRETAQRGGQHRLLPLAPAGLATLGVTINTDRLEQTQSPFAFPFRPPPERERTEETGLLLLTSDLRQGVPAGNESEGARGAAAHPDIHLQKEHPTAAPFPPLLSLKRETEGDKKNDPRTSRPPHNQSGGRAKSLR